MSKTSNTTAADPFLIYVSEVVAQAKLDAACIEAHNMGRHAQSGQFIAFCVSCQAEDEARQNLLRNF